MRFFNPSLFRSLVRQAFRSHSAPLQRFHIDRGNQAQWLKANMLFDKATADRPFLSDAEALDIAAFVNSDELHKRPSPKNFEYPFPNEKAIDYDKGPFVDDFTEKQHKYGPYPPIVSYWKKADAKRSTDATSFQLPIVPDWKISDD